MHLHLGTGCNYFLILEIRATNCYNLPDDMNFLEIGGVFTPPPPGVSALLFVYFQYLTLCYITNRYTSMALDWAILGFLVQ